MKRWCNLIPLGVAFYCAAGSLAVVAQSAHPAAEAIAALRTGHPAQALRACQRGLRRNGSDSRLWSLEGIAALRLSRPALALRAFQRALRVSPSDLPALEGAAELEYRRGCACARPLLLRILQQRPLASPAESMLAMLAYRRRNWLSAVRRFRLSGRAGQSPAALAAYGASLYHLRRYPAAVAVFGRWTRRQPANPAARYDLALAELAARQLAAAARILAPVVAAPQAPGYALGLQASILARTGHTPQAVALLRRAIARQPQHSGYYLQFATLAYDSRSFRAGIAMLNAGLHVMPRSTSLHIARGILRVRLGQYARADQDFAAAEKSHARRSFTALAQSMADYESDHWRRALATARRRLRQDPRNPYLRYVVAEILTQHGGRAAHRSQASRYLRQAIRLKPDFWPARNALAGLELQRGRLAAAIAQCRQVLRHRPLNATALYHLMLALRQEGKTRQAESLLQRLTQAHLAAQRRAARRGRYHLLVLSP